MPFSKLSTPHAAPEGAVADQGPSEKLADPQELLLERVALLPELVDSLADVPAFLAS